MEAFSFCFGSDISVLDEAGRQFKSHVAALSEAEETPSKSIDLSDREVPCLVEEENTSSVLEPYLITLASLIVNLAFNESLEEVFNRLEINKGFYKFT
jgi:hypothetical protein